MNSVDSNTLHNLRQQLEAQLKQHEEAVQQTYGAIQLIDQLLAQLTQSETDKPIEGNHHVRSDNSNSE